MTIVDASVTVLEADFVVAVEEEDDDENIDETNNFVVAGDTGELFVKLETYLVAEMGGECFVDSVGVVG